MRIGKIELKNPFLLAPLAGITDAPFRLLAAEKGAAMTYSEMVSCKGLYYKDKNTARLLATLPGEGDVAYQLFGAEPDMLHFAAKELAARENRIYDINMGCPVPKVVKNGEGSALLRSPKLAGELVKAACEGAREGAAALGREAKPVTAKIRMGFDADSVNAVEVGRALQDGGAAAVAIHGRTREQYYSGKADWDVIKTLKEALDIPVIGNGDIYSAEDALAMMAHTGCDAVMIARGALGNPWIFEEAAAVWEELGRPDGSKLAAMGEENVRKLCRKAVAKRNRKISREEKTEMMLRHFQLSLDFKGEYAAVREMRKHVGWYLKGEHGAARLRGSINTITSADELKKAIRSITE